MFGCIDFTFVFYGDFIIGGIKGEFCRKRGSCVDKVDKFFVLSLDSYGLG